MRPIIPGGRGPAVEDIQRRLLILGYDLGPTGVDGVFLGKTREAVTAFQSMTGVAEDGIVGDETWAALVDATFTLGDRTLYLRLPYFHGRDVRALQEALCALGFACGSVDGIFGVFTERAVREFQRNCGQPVDGIAGPATVGIIMGLRHVWAGKDTRLPGEGVLAPARDVTPLLAVDVMMGGRDASGGDVAARVVNLALASDSRVRVSLEEPAGAPGHSEGLAIVLGALPPESPDTPLVTLGDDSPAGFAGRMITALAAAPARRISVDLGDHALDDEARQRAAVRVLDGLCSALA